MRFYARLMPSNDTAKLALSTVYDNLDEQDLRRELVVVGDPPVEAVLRIDRHLEREESSPDDANSSKAI